MIYDQQTAEPTASSPREVLVRVRAALRTCLLDAPGDLARPERRSVLERRIAECSHAIAQMGAAHG
jgi:hypothetical protein